MLHKKIFLTLAAFIFLSVVFSQKNNSAKGNLFIIGGGSRSNALMQKLLDVAQLSKKDYVAVLPMSGEEPDSSYLYFKWDLEKVCANKIVNLNFTADKVTDKIRLDSLKHAKLIFITGGDQVRFMKVVLHSPVYDAIHASFNDGATIAGTSAGAAVMSRHMLTGNQLLDTVYSNTFDKLKFGNVEFAEGLGLIDTSIIIDQHFIRRSRYNRLLSAIAAFPKSTCIGIDEATAIIVHQNKITVTGISEVAVFKHPENLKISPEGLIKFSDLHFSIYTGGDSFLIP